MTLHEAVRMFEACFFVGSPTAQSVSVTGESYVVVVSGGLVTEGDRLPALYSNPDLAIAAWLQAARDYAHAANGKSLYWRICPELTSFNVIECDENGDNKWPADLKKALVRRYYQVYSRMLVSDKPVLEKVG